MKLSHIITIDESDVHVKGGGQRSMSQRSEHVAQILAFPDHNAFEITCYGMMHWASCDIEERPYYFQGHPPNVNDTRAAKSSI